MHKISDVPLPAGAIADGWHFLDGPHREDVCRFLTWARFDVADMEISAAGTQYATGHIERYVRLLATANDDLTPARARQLAAAVLSAANVLDESL